MANTFLQNLVNASPEQVAAIARAYGLPETADIVDIIIAAEGDTKPPFYRLEVPMQNLFEKIAANKADRLPPKLSQEELEAQAAHRAEVDRKLEEEARKPTEFKPAAFTVLPDVNEIKERIEDLMDQLADALRDYDAANGRNWQAGIKQDECAVAMICSDFRRIYHAGTDQWEFTDASNNGFNPAEIFEGGIFTGDWNE